MKKILILSLILLISIVTAAFLILPPRTDTKTTKRPFYVGVTYCGNSTAEAQLLINRVKNYTNLLIIQSLSFSRNVTALTEICDYAVAQNLSIIINFLNAANLNVSMLTWQLPLLENAEQRWGNQFLGVYYDDEPGGIHIDYNWTDFFALPEFAQFAPNSTSTPRDYSNEARWFTSIIRINLRPERWKEAGITSLTSDYALYWWDYLGGYDIILAQLGRNHTLEQDIALLRGAAKMQNKTWGTIITWTYDDPPYIIDNKETIYEQLLMSYEAGATYVVIFNYPQIDGNPYGGILTDNHFEALESFWNNIVTESNQESIADYSQAEAVLVLPSNYGWGMRHENDRIWGMWGPDEKSPQTWEISRQLLSQYYLNLDIIFEDPKFPVAGKYPKIYYWNQTG
jgi:hypothetical protein